MCLLGGKEFYHWPQNKFPNKSIMKKNLFTIPDACVLHGY
jgi:hypothetical protein